MKSPAFRLYADDFLAGTMDLSQEDVGSYIRLLCHQWNRGSIPVEPEKQHRLAGGLVSDDVLSKFQVGEDGLLRNARLEDERARQDQFRAVQSEKGKKSGIARKHSTGVEPRLNSGSTSVQPAGQPKSNPPLPLPLPSPEKKERGTFVPPTHEEVMTQADMIGLPPPEARKFIPFYESKGWMVGKTKMKSWISALSGWKARWDEKNQTGAVSELPLVDQDVEDLKRRMFE